MTQIRNLQKAPNGYYYLRLQRNGKDRRISLKTRDLSQAQFAVNLLHATLSGMTINSKQIKDWTLETDGQNLKITTEDNDADRASALEAVKAYVIGKNSNYADLNQSVHKPTTPLSEALEEYLPYLYKQDLALKTQKMAESTLRDLAVKLGPSFDMSKLNDEIIETSWLEPRLQKVARTTVKRDLTFIRGFIEWAADKKRKYSLAPLALTIEAKGENWEYYNKDDLKLIFDNLPIYAEAAWQFWLPIIALYTGGRIAEIAGMHTSYVSEKSGINAMRFAGTKTDASDRTIPIHPDLIDMGFLEYVKSRVKAKKKMLFDITTSQQNGDGAQASKWFTSFKRSIGLTDPLKVFHSFRPTIVDHLKQAGCEFEARCQYVGHDAGGGVHNKVYGRNELNLQNIYEQVVTKINWLQYCGWEPNIKLIKHQAEELKSI